MHLFKTLITFSAMTLTAATISSYAQVATSSTTSGVISVTRLHEIMRQPNGLENLSKLVGDVTLNDSEEPWGEHDLRSLVKNSDVIVTAVIVNRQSYLTENGDNVSTDYLLDVSTSLKGRAGVPLTVSVHGGQVQLSTGHSATIHSSVWDVLQPGQKLLLFLKQTGSKYQIIGATQGVLSVTGTPEQIHFADKQPMHNLSLRRDLDGAGLVAAEQRILGEVNRNQ
jgi:hypothetical protein